jgi:hemoglobin/transferrin/lactoferrin receptor protein
VHFKNLAHRLPHFMQSILGEILVLDRFNWKHSFAFPLILAFLTLTLRAEEKLPDPAKPATSEQPAEYKNNSKPAIIVIDEIVVTATRVAESVNESPQAVGVATQQELLRKQARTGFQTLAEEPGIFLSQANESFRFPIIRGRREGDNVYLRDGVRQSQFQSLDFPIGLIERVEYIRGPGGIQYGSNAIGGVVNTITKKVDHFSEKPTFGGEVLGRYNSAIDELTEFGDVWMSSKRVNFFIGASHSEFGDVHGPREEDIKHSGGFRTTNWYTNIGIQVAKNHEVRMEYIGMGKEDQIFYGQSKRNKSLPNNHLPFEDRDLTKISYKGTDIAPFLSEIKTWYFYNTNDRLSYQTLETATNRNTNENTVDEDSMGAGLQATSLLPIGKDNRLIYGIDWRLDDADQPRKLRSRTFAANTVTRRDIPALIPQNYYEVYDGWFIGEFNPLDRLQITAGLRYENTHFTSKPEAIDPVPPFILDDITLDKTWNAFVYSFGANVKATEKLTFVTNVGSGFRVPQNFELLITGVQGNVSGVSTIPSTTLEPVESRTYDVGARYKSSRFKGSITGYYTELENLINFVNTNITINAPGVGIVPTRRNENASTGYIYGVEADLQVRLIKQVSLLGNFTYTRGQNTEQDVPLRSIPPPFGLVGVRWEKEDGRWWAETWVNMVGRFYRDAPDDRTQQSFAREPGFGSANTTTNPPLRTGFEIPGYATWGIRGGGDICTKGTKKLSVVVAIENILNQHYRPPFAEIPEAPGTSASISIHFKF